MRTGPDRHIPAAEIADRARRRWGEENRRLSSARELRIGRKGSISVVLVGEKAGLWFDHEARVGGTLLTDDEVGHRKPEPKPRHGLIYDSDSADRLARTLQHLAPIEGTASELYLRSRGITQWPHSIRHCSYPHGMVALAQTIRGDVLACQIVYLTADGRKQDRWDGVVKRTYTACSGWHAYAAVRMPGGGRPILCEGPETALSVWIAFERKRTVLACLGIAGLGELRLPARRITIARDGDQPGSPADGQVRRAIDRRSGGQRVAVASPPQGLDWNDVLVADGPQAVREMIEAAERT